MQNEVNPLSYALLKNKKMVGNYQSHTTNSEPTDLVEVKLDLIIV